MHVTRRAVLKAAGSATVGAVAGLAGYGYAYERHALRVVHAELPVSGLSPLHDGLRVGLVTDLHHSEFTSQADIAKAVDLTMAQRPDCRPWRRLRQLRRAPLHGTVRRGPRRAGGTRWGLRHHGQP